MRAFRTLCINTVSCISVKVLMGVLFILTAAVSAGERVIYVSTEGNDAFSGTIASVNADKTDGPLRTPNAALQKVKEIRESGNPTEPPIPLVIEMADGLYELDETLVITPEMGGTADSPTILRAASGARPVISGGRTLTGFSVADDGRWHLTLDEVKNDGWYFSQLFVNNQRRYRPRWPKDRNYTITERIESPFEIPGYEIVGKRSGDKKFRFKDDEIQSTWHNLTDIEVMVYHNWILSRQRIESVDDTEKVVTVMGASPNCLPEFSWGFYAAGNQYYLENVSEALSLPGEFYLDRSTGELTYIPQEGETPENVTVTAPKLEYLMIIMGRKDRFVENLKFEGLTFAFSNWVTPRYGNSSPQAEAGIDAAITIAGGRDLTFTECGFRNIGHYALIFGTACKDALVERCAMKDIGGGGIRIGGDLYNNGWPYEKLLCENDANRQLFDLPKNERIVERVTVQDSLFEYLGRIHPAAVGIWIGHAAHNTVERCEVYDLFYSAISVGWIWGYSESVANHNTIRNNHLHKIGQKILSDMGAVYTLGISPGTKITENLIHDVDSYSYGGWGLYTDEGSSGVEMSRNIVYDTKSGSYNHHYGKENRIAYNIFSQSKEVQLRRSVVENHDSFSFDHNIVYWWNDSPLLGGDWEDEHFRMDHNIYWNPNYPDITFNERSFAAWQNEKGRDIHSSITDPQLKDPENGDFSFSADSPAARLGLSIPEHFGPTKRPTMLDDIPVPPTWFIRPQE